VYAAGSLSRALVTTSTTIAVLFAARPTSSTRFAVNRRAMVAPSSDVVMAVSTCGRNIAPYCVLLRSYSVGSVKIELAAGNVTRVMPCTSPARLTIRFSALDAMAVASVRKA